MLRIKNIKFPVAIINEDDSTTTYFTYGNYIPKSGVRGVTFDKATGKWLVRHTSGGRSFHLGRYADLQEAIETKELFAGYIKRVIPAVPILIEILTAAHDDDDTSAWLFIYEHVAPAALDCDFAEYLGLTDMSLSREVREARMDEFLDNLVSQAVDEDSRRDDFDYILWQLASNIIFNNGLEDAFAEWNVSLEEVAGCTF